jgi:hypothetical protein
MVKKPLPARGFVKVPSGSWKLHHSKAKPTFVGWTSIGAGRFCSDVPRFQSSAVTLTKPYYLPYTACQIRAARL